MTTPSITEVRELAARYSNWGRWGAEDEIGTLNHVEPSDVAAAASLVQLGKVISLALPLDSTGPQPPGHPRRFNPIHVMTLDGSDVMAGFDPGFGGGGKYLQVADDMLILPLQCSTQWDGLSHIMFEERMYNGFSAALVSSRGADRLGVAMASEHMVGRGVLLDVASYLQLDALPPGYAISSDELAATAASQGVEVRKGDFVLVRTGHMATARARGNWGDYSGGSAPGLGLEAVPWIGDHRIAALCTDTWGVEVLPNQTPDVFQPCHIILIVHMGLWLGEIFDLDVLASTCKELGRYEFFFSAPPLTVTKGVGSPLNPMAIL